MSKKILIPAVIIAAAGLGYVGTGWWLGGQVEAHNEAYHQFLNKQAYLKIAQASYHRGVFSSTAETTLELTGSVAYSYREVMSKLGVTAAPFRLTLKETIQHGPFPGLMHGDFHPARAIVKTEIVWPEHIRKALAEVYGNQDPLSLTTFVAWNGDRRMEVQSPALTKQLDNGEGTVQWSGLAGQVNYNSKFDHYVYHFDSAGLTATGKDGSKVAVSQISFDGESQRAFDDLMLGKSGFKIADIRFEPKMPLLPAVQMKGLNYQVDATAQGEYVDVAARVGLDTVTAQGKKYGPAHYDIKLTHLHGPTLAKLSQALTDIQKQDISPDQANGMMMGALMQHGIPLLQHTPEFQIERISIELPEGEAKITARAKLVNFDGSEIQQPAKLLEKVDAAVDIAFPEAVARQLAAKAMATKLAAGGATGEGDIQALIDQQIESLIGQNYVVRSGKQLTTKAAFLKGKLQVNGHDVPLPMLPGAAGAQEEEPQEPLPQ